MSRLPPSDSSPPAVVRFLLHLLLPKEEREFYLGDLEESGRRPWLREIVGAAMLRLTPRPRRPVCRLKQFSQSPQRLNADRMGVVDGPLTQLFRMLVAIPT